LIDCLALQRKTMQICTLLLLLLLLPLLLLG
jgi:hypothetical protein